MGLVLAYMRRRQPQFDLRIRPLAAAALQARRRDWFVRLH